MRVRSRLSVFFSIASAFVAGVGVPAIAPDFGVQPAIAQTAIEITANKRMCVFTIGGQSNASGVGERRGPDVPGDYVKVYDPSTGSWLPANDPLPYGGLGSSWPAFGTEFWAQTGVNVLFVQAAIDGGYQLDANRALNNPPSAESWDDNGTATPRAIALTQAALNWAISAGFEAKFCGVLWRQGESEGNGIQWCANGGVPNHPNCAADINKAAYKAALQRMIRRFRQPSWAGSTAPFYIFQLGAPQQNSPAMYSSAEGFRQVREAQEETRLEMSNVLMATRLGTVHGVRSMIVHDSAGVHFNTDALNESGLDAARNVVQSGLWNRWAD